MRLLLLLTVLAALAVVSVSGDEFPPSPAPPLEHRCIHDEIFSEQFGEEPFSEVLASRRFEASTVTTVPTNGTARAAASAEYSPIRIKVFYDDVNDPAKYCTEVGQVRPDFKGSTLTCTKTDIMTPAKRSLLINSMIPDAVKMHTERLSVEPLDGMVITPLTGKVCGSFTVPSTVLNQNLEGVDYVLFVATGPVQLPTMAWAGPCKFVSGSGRPAVGIVNVNAFTIDGTDQSIRVMAHEIMHALGFSGAQFQSHNMVTTVANLRGKPTTPVVDSANTLAKAKEQFNCNTMPGMELDDSGGAGTAGSHWSVRNARDDLMCGYVGPMMRYTAVSLGAMEDLGFYQANYSMAEGAPWGHDEGCGLINDKCVKNGVSQFPNMFCATPDGSRGNRQCSPDLLGIGVCSISTYNSIPSYFQYFSNPKLGGSATAEYCPYVTPFGNMLCRNGNTMLMPDSLLGESSRCITPAPGSAAVMPVCADIQCSSTSSTYKIKFYGSSTYEDCPPGSIIDANASSPEFTSGNSFICPPYFTLCSTTFSVGGNTGDNAALGLGAGPVALSLFLPALTLLLSLLY